MTDETQEDAPKSSNARKAAIGIGSAAVAAALLYAGKRFLQKPEDGAGQTAGPPSGEPPETD